MVKEGWWGREGVMVGEGYGMDEEEGGGVHM